MVGHRGALPNNFTPLSQIKPCCGPMGKTVEDVKIGLEVLFHERLNLHDPFVPPAPFRHALYESAYKGNHKIGYFDSLDTSPSASFMKRAVHIAKEALERKGFTMIPIRFADEDIKEARDIFIGLVVNYMLGPMIKQLDDNYESPLQCYKLTIMFWNTNFVVRNILLGLLRLTGNSRIADNAKNLKPLS
jgi:Asp-tRNA(Asn)/Glu-tRNA(Gln) amidotransferase A subunit family amidase